MTETSNPFDPNQVWLVEASKDQPTKHFRLPGIDESESDTSVIDQAESRATAGERQRSKSWLDDWRVLADAASMFVLVGIVVVIFTNTRGDSRNATQLAGSDTVELELSDDWLDGLRIVDDFSQPLKERFQLDRGGDLCTIQDQRLVIVPAKAKERFGSLDANEVKLARGQAVAIDTNLRTSLPEGLSVGLVVGPIRVRLASRKDSLQISVHDQPLGSFQPTSDSPITLVVARDATDPSIFRWVVKAADKNIAGRAKYTATVADQLQVGILFRSSKQEVEVPIWIDDLRIGRLSNPPELKNAPLVQVNPKSDEAE